MAFGKWGGGGGSRSALPVEGREVATDRPLDSGRERRQGSHDWAHRQQGSHTRAHLAAGSHDVIPTKILFSIITLSHRLGVLASLFQRGGPPHCESGLYCRPPRCLLNSVAGKTKNHPIL